MANNVHKYGFRMVSGGNGRSVPNPIEMAVADAYQAKADDTTTSVDLRPGDPVKLVSTGTVALANTTDLVYGVVVAVPRIYAASEGGVRPSDRVPGATTGGGLLERQTRVMVQIAKGVIFEIDVDEAATATTEAAYQAFINENVEHVCVADTTNANQPKADPRIDISTHAVTAGLGWRIVGISKSAENRDFSGTNVKLLVMVNDSNEAGSAATNVVGV